MFTKQETFDTVAKHLLVQNAKAVIPDHMISAGQSRCRYRTPEGLKCAAGCLIPDDKYNLVLENHSVKCGDVINPVGQLLISLGHDIDLCKDLQLIHDTFSPIDWRRELKELAKEYNLEWRFK